MAPISTSLCLVICALLVAACGGRHGGGDQPPPPAPLPPPPPSANANLASLAIDGVTLSPGFAPSRTTYDASVGFLASSILVTPTAEDSTATVALNGATAPSGAFRSVALTEGSNTLEARVTAANGATQSYSVAIWRQPAASFAPAVYIKAANAEPFDNFGFAVALQGDTLVVGAPGVDSAGNKQLNQDGAVYVFRRDAAGTWAQEAYLQSRRPPSIVGGNQRSAFGNDVALDGDTLVVGDPLANCTAGAVHVFVRAAAAWTEQAYFPGSSGSCVVPNAVQSDLLGSRVSVSGDVMAATAFGRIHLYERIGTSWNRATSLPLAVLNPAGRLFLDGGLLAVGLPTDSSGATGINGPVGNSVRSSSGAVLLWRRASSTSWLQEAYIKASNSRRDARFGSAIALQGDRLVVGAPGETSASTGVNGDQNDTTKTNAGAVYVFEHGAGGWTQSAYVKASSTAVNDSFGAAIALDGDRLLASGRNSTGFYLFAFDATGEWSERLAFGTPGLTSSGVAIDGDTFVVGDWREDGCSRGIDAVRLLAADCSDAGAAYVYSINAAPNADPRLKSFETLPRALDQEFQPDRFSYTTTTGLLSDDLVLTLDPIGWGRVVVNGVPAEGRVTVPLAPGVNRIVLEVSADDGRATATYTLDATRPTTVTFPEGTYLKSSYPDVNDAFGTSIAFDGDTLVIGAPHESSGVAPQDDNSAPDAGAVYVFVRDRFGRWAQQAFLKASNLQAGDLFGASVALDGNRLLVGAPGADGLDELTPDAGGAYVFTRIASGQWVQVAYLQDGARDPGDRMGSQVGLRGRWAFASAVAEAGLTDPTVNVAPFAGAVIVFTEFLPNSNSWFQQSYVKASNPEAGDRFGSSLSFSADGLTLAVGAPYEDGASSGVNGAQTDGITDSGAVYLFAYDQSIQPPRWTQIAYVKATNTGPGDLFGSAVAVSGSLLAVGAPGESSAAIGIGGNQLDDFAARAGAVYLYELHSLAQWQPTSYIKQPDTQAGDEFGGSVAILSNVLAAGLVGRPQAPGAVHVFTRASGGTWSLIASPRQGSGDHLDRFGSSIAISGRTLAVGAVGEDGGWRGVGGNQLDNSMDGAGAVYVVD